METTHKRSRCKNFTENEKTLLIDIIDGYKHVINRKGVDAVNVKAKIKTWGIVTKEYNDVAEESRTCEQLRSLYKNLKSQTRQKDSEINACQHEPESNAEAPKEAFVAHDAIKEEQSYLDEFPQQDDMLNSIGDTPINDYGRELFTLKIKREQMLLAYESELMKLKVETERLKCEREKLLYEREKFLYERDREKYLANGVH